MNTNGQHRTRLPNVAGSVSELTHDVIELTELQTQLFALDVKTSVAKARAFLILCVVGVCLLLGTIPVALLVVAALLVEQLSWSMAAGVGVAALLGLVLCAIVLGVAWTYVKSGLVSLDRSREEFNRNISWLKSTLRSRSQRHATEKPVNF